MPIRCKSIWMHRNISGTSLHKTGHHLQMWHNSQEVFQTMALLVPPGPPPMKYLYTKFQQPSWIPCMWAPTPKKPKSHN